MKSTVVDESLSSMNLQFCSREITCTSSQQNTGFLQSQEVHETFMHYLKQKEHLQHCMVMSPRPEKKTPPPKCVIQSRCFLAKLPTPKKHKLFQATCGTVM